MLDNGVLGTIFVALLVCVEDVLRCTAIRSYRTI